MTNKTLEMSKEKKNAEYLTLDYSELEFDCVNTSLKEDLLYVFKRILYQPREVSFLCSRTPIVMTKSEFDSNFSDLEERIEQIKEMDKDWKSKGLKNYDNWLITELQKTYSEMRRLKEDISKKTRLYEENINGDCK